MGEPGGLPSMGSHRVGHDWSNLAAAAAEFVRGSHGQDMIAIWPPSWGHFRGSLPPPLSLECKLRPPSPQWEHFPRMQPWWLNSSWDLLDGHMWLNPRTASLQTLAIRAGMCGELLVSWGPGQASAVSPCLLNLPPIHLKWPLSLVSPYLQGNGTSFRLHPGKLPRLRSNRAEVLCVDLRTCWLGSNPDSAPSQLGGVLWMKEMWPALSANEGRCVIKSPP